MANRLGGMIPGREKLVQAERGCAMSYGELASASHTRQRRTLVLRTVLQRFEVYPPVPASRSVEIVEGSDPFTLNGIWLDVQDFLQNIFQVRAVAKVVA